jgi:uncharacterized protein YodC (DUF2158 family)
MADLFKKGDVVRLRSGGPAMTVSHTPEDTDEHGERLFAKYHCVWFIEETRQTAAFEEHLLEVFIETEE